MIRRRRGAVPISAVTSSCYAFVVYITLRHAYVCCHGAHSIEVYERYPIEIVGQYVRANAQLSRARVGQYTRLCYQRLGRVHDRTRAVRLRLLGFVRVARHARATDTITTPVRQQPRLSRGTSNWRGA